MSVNNRGRSKSKDRQRASTYSKPTVLEHLERRVFLNATLTSSIPNTSAIVGSAASSLNLNSYFDDPNVTGTAVVFQTNLPTNNGVIPIALQDAAAPNTVANFLDYVEGSTVNGVTAGTEAGTIIHRVSKLSDGGNLGIPVIQGGALRPNQTENQTLAPIVLESSLPNVQYTIAMARTMDPNSATDQWFINSADNSATLQPGVTNGVQNANGYAVFGDIVYGGKSVVDSFANLVRGTLATNLPDFGTLTTVPTTDGSGNPMPSNEVIIESASVVSPLSFAVLSSNTNIVTASVSGGMLQLTPSSTQSGMATITVTATDLGGNVATAMFAVNVAPAQAPSVTTDPVSQTVSTAGTATFTAAASGVPTPTVQWQSSADGGITFNDIAGATSTSYTPPATDPTGTDYRAIFTNVGGVATSHFATLNIQSSIAIGNFAHRILFTSPNGVATTIYSTGPGSGSLTLVGSVTESTSRTGVVTVSGTPVSFSIAMTGTTGGTSLNIQGARGAAVAGLTGISTNGSLFAITATNVALTGNVSVAGTARSLRFGDVSGGTFIISGSAGSFSLAVGHATGESIDSSQAISSLTAVSWLLPTGSTTPGSITGTTISRLAVPGELDTDISATSLGVVTAGTIAQGVWTLSGALTSLTAGSITNLELAATTVGRVTSRGAIATSLLGASRSIAAVSAASITGTELLAGNPTIDSNGIPTAFTDTARIGAVTIGAGGFSNALITADMIGTAHLGVVPSVNSSSPGTMFGLAAHQIDSLVATIDGKRVVAVNVKSQATVDAALTKAGITTTNDLVIRIA
jgi:cyclophilin family peptidyl-prolyl cis-trans isomerase